MNDFERTLKILCDAGVRFVVIGGVAASAHGSAHLTYDLDICYDRARDNIERLAKALEPHRPRLRGVPDDLPFRFDTTTIGNGMNFTLTTDLGDIDLFGEVIGIGGYKDVKALSITVVLLGYQCDVLSLEGLIQSKRATARPKDLLTLPEVEALREIGTQLKPQSGAVEVRNEDRVEDKQSEHKPDNNP
jgi:predicted nucleotidyltransferase